MAPRLQGCSPTVDAGLLRAGAGSRRPAVSRRRSAVPAAAAAPRHQRLSERLVGGSLFGSAAGLQDHWLSRLVPLADEVEGSDDVYLFAQVARLRAAAAPGLHSVPLDPEAAGTAAADRPARMAGLLEPTLPSSLRRLTLPDCSTEVVRYITGHRCVLRCELPDGWSRSRRTLKQVLYGKAYAASAAL